MGIAVCCPRILGGLQGVNYQGGTGISVRAVRTQIYGFQGVGRTSKGNVLLKTSSLREFKTLLQNLMGIIMLLKDTRWFIRC